MGVGLLLYFATAKIIEEDSDKLFTNHATSAQKSIDARIKSYTDVLRSTASLFRTTDAVSRQQFHAYVSGLALERHFPAIESINFAAYVRHSDRAAFEQRMRADQRNGAFGGPPLQITPPGIRPEYTVIIYTEPNVAPLKTIGLDLQANDQARNNVMEKSRNEGTLLASGIPIPTISTPSQKALALRMPLYRRAMPINTEAQRRETYIGSLGIAFSVPKLIKGVVDGIPIQNVRLTLVSGNVDAPEHGNATWYERVLFDSIATDSNPTPPLLVSDDVFISKQEIDFNGEDWTAIFSVDKAALNTGFDEYVPWLAMVAGGIGSMLIYALLYTLTTSRINAIRLAEEMTKELRDSQAKLQLSHMNLRRLAAHAENIKEGERKRIAREIHDDLGQNLLALRIEADMLCSRTRERHPRLHARACATVQQIDATIKSVRQIINDLRPNVLDLGLNAAVDWQIGEFRRLSGIRCELIENEQEVKVSDRCATALFRILQESLSNISRHARATAVEVDLRVAGDHVCMKVGDNGVGMQHGIRKPESFGLIGIQERIRILGGTFEIISEPGQGTTIKVSVPQQEDGRYLDKETSLERLEIEETFLA